MLKPKRYKFNARIYRSGINYVVDVPELITAKLKIIKGYIKVKGTVNNFPFNKSLVPVKNAGHRLFVNLATLKGAKAKLGDVAKFALEEDAEDVETQYPIPEEFEKLIKEKGLEAQFESLSPYRRKEILKYLNIVKAPQTLDKHIKSIIYQLENKAENLKIP
ncbi:MAG: DUF1905 domain-containing protein [Pedobacter sp.]|nr:MAG: DUF1905 domain-containing protein [Pedobacter sp.]